jgi:hypothetical protein
MMRFYRMSRKGRLTATKADGTLLDGKTAVFIGRNEVGYLSVFFAGLFFRCGYEIVKGLLVMVFLLSNDGGYPLFI